jgi:transcriptional regulator with XRE-family HTH domain
MEGLTDKEIAERFGIAKSTLNKWKIDFSTFSDSLKAGKEPIDAEVQKSLYQRAIGYSFKEKKVIVELDSNGNQKPARIETTEKIVPPDTTAQIFWLKNRRPDLWREKQEIELANPFLELMKAAAVDGESENNK